MKQKRSISLFLSYSVLILAMGILLGFSLGTVREKKEQKNTAQDFFQKNPEVAQEVPIRAVSALEENILCADTEYLIEEYDVRRESVITRKEEIPPKYMGMNRDEFVAAMEIYSFSPPLSEQERGFISAEVTTFSRKRVVVRMNYIYITPPDVFYLSIMNNQVIVFCEDRTTVYLETGILGYDLPEEVQIKLIMGMEMDTEEELYRFLETYSS